MKIKGAVVLVTGGGHRLGRAISIGLAQAGARLAIHYNQSEKQARTTQDEILALGRESILVKGDLSRAIEIAKVVSECTQHFGTIDVLVNNAALYFETPLSSTTEADWNKLVDVNLKSPYFCSKYAAQSMLARKRGKIINIADIAGIKPWPKYIPYSVTKAGLIAMTKGLAQELAPDIQVNAIAPGTVLIGKEEILDPRQTTLLKKVGSPEDVVNTIRYLVEGSDYITGEVIAVDGGRLLV